jgi:hypothetical protein
VPAGNCGAQGGESVDFLVERPLDGVEVQMQSALGLLSFSVLPEEQRELRLVFVQFDEAAFGCALHGTAECSAPEQCQLVRIS